MNNRIVGKKQEERAGKYLEAKGMKILQYNYQIRSGEIDIIGKYKGYLVFVEVKYRKTDSKGNGL